MNLELQSHALLGKLVIYGLTWGGRHGSSCFNKGFMVYLIVTSSASLSPNISNNEQAKTIPHLGGSALPSFVQIMS